MQSIEIVQWNKDRTISAIVKATFPRYKRRKVYISACASVCLYDLNWSGGTRSEYRACTVAGDKLGTTERFHRYAPWDERQIEGLEVPIPAGSIVVRGGYFCGKESILTLHVNPADMPRFLPKPE